MAVAPVDIPIQVKGLSDLEKLERRLLVLEKEVTRLQNTAPKAAKAVRGIGAGAKGAVGGIRAFGAALTSALGPLAPIIASIGGLTAAFNTLKAQDFAEAKFASLGGNSDQLVANLGVLSKELQGQASVAELTGAAYDVASAGFSSAAEASLVLKAAAQGATGGFSDINTVGNAATSVLNAYGLSAESAGKLVDQFIQTQNDGKIVVAEYAQNIGKVASAAAGLDIPLSEVNAVIAQSTAAGNQAEVAFTGLKGALARLASGEASKALEGTGINIDAASLKADGLLGTLKKLEGLDTGQIFKALGTEAGPALLPIIQNLERYEELIKNQEEANGTAAAAATTASGTIEGAWKRVTVAFQNLFSDQTELGQLIRGTLLSAAATVEALGAAFKLIVAPIRAVIEVVKGVISAVFDVKDSEAVLQSFTKLWFEIIAAVEDAANTIIAVGKVVGDFIGGLVSKLATTFSNLWNSIANGVQGVVGAITGAFRTAFENALKLVTSFFNALPNWLKGALSKVGSIAGGIAGAVTNALKTVANKIQEAKVQIQLDVPDIKKLKLPTIEQPNTGTGTGTGTGAGSSTGDSLAREAQKRAEAMRKMVAAGEDLEKQQRRELQLLNAADELEKSRLKNLFEFEDKIQEINEKAAPFQREGLISQATALRNKKDLDALGKAAEEAGRKLGESLAKDLPEARTELTDLQQLGADAFKSITGNLQSGIKGLIDGTKDLNDVLSDLLSSLADLALSFAFNALGSRLSIPGFADGGRPEPNKLSIVGEEGPELFVPDTAGTVIPNDFFSDARNALSSSPGSDLGDNAEAFAVASAAVARNTQTVNNRQSTTNQENSFNSFAESLLKPGQSTVKFETINVGDMPMVTRDEALRIGAQSAKAAEAAVFNALKNKPSVRRSVGMT